jgi:hypothetical protein
VLLLLLLFGLWVIQSKMSKVPNHDQLIST